MKLKLPGPKTRSGRRLAGFLILSLSAHAVAFSLFRDPGEFAPIPPPSPGKVMLMSEEDLPGGFAQIFEPSAIVYPGSPPARLAEAVILPWQDTQWAAQPPVQAPVYRPAQVGADAPLAVRAEESLGHYRSSLLPKAGPSKGRPVLETWFEITGHLKGRKSTSELQLPAMKTTSALEPTAARIGVDEDGAVRFVFLEGTSGDPAVDREALNLLRTWRLNRLPGSGSNGAGCGSSGRSSRPGMANREPDSFTTSSGLSLSFSWHRFCFVDGWRMASLASIPPVSGNGFLPALRNAQPPGPRLAYPALPPLRRPASRGKPRD